MTQIKTGQVHVQQILPDDIPVEMAVKRCESMMYEFLRETIFSGRSITIRDMGIEAQPTFREFRPHISYRYLMLVGIANPEETEIGEYTFMEAPLDMKTIMIMSGKMFRREYRDLWERIG